jgi:cytochrome c556
MIKMIKVLALKPFDAGKGLVKKGDLIEIPEELLNHFTKNGKAVLPPVKEAKAKLKKAVDNFKAKKEEVKEVVKAVKKAKRKTKSKK